MIHTQMTARFVFKNHMLPRDLVKNLDDTSAQCRSNPTYDFRWVSKKLFALFHCFWVILILKYSIAAQFALLKNEHLGLFF